jgi:hypothetical protein
MHGIMATYIPKNISITPGECTEFQLHKSQQTIFHGILRKIFDYTEYRLSKYIDQVKDSQQKLMLIALLKDYISGSVAIAWKRGQPVWIKVTKA